MDSCSHQNPLREFTNRLLARRREIALEIMHLPAALFHRILDEPIFVDVCMLTNVVPVASGDRGHCFTALVSLSTESFVVNEEFLFKWIQNSDTVDRSSDATNKRNKRRNRKDYETNQYCDSSSMSSNSPGGSMTVLDEVIEETAHLHNVFCLGHPNIVQPATTPSLQDNTYNRQVYTIIIWDSTTSSFAITMRKVNPLELIDNDITSTLSLAQRITIFAQLADCLNFLHQYGLHHWDLYTDNYIIDSHGEPVIIDLGSMSGATPRNRYLSDTEALADIIFDLELDKCEKEPFVRWSELVANQFWGEFPMRMEAVCAELGCMSVGPLTLIEEVELSDCNADDGGDKENMVVRYICLRDRNRDADADAEADADADSIVDTDKISLVETCYSVAARNSQKQRINELARSG
jgi:hypothetical protein